MNSSRPVWLLGLILLAGLLPDGLRADPIYLRISVKFILGPSGQMPCCGNGTFDSFSDITNQVEVANDYLSSTGRGYQFRISEVTTVSGVATNFFSNPREDKDLLEIAAEANKTAFKYRDNAVNMYVNDANGSAICSFPPTDDIILYGQSSRSTSLWHESGHYFNLSHTHSGELFQNSNGSNCTNECACAVLIGGTSDSIPDTIADHECWGSLNAVAQGNYGLNYASLTSGQKAAVDRVYYNIMSYHDTRDRMTSDQLDRWTDAANGDRNQVATGRTRFVDRDNGGIQTGSSALPWRTVATGVTVASSSGGDIVLVRPGAYNETMTITKPLTLRATRGNATIGSATALLDAPK